MQRRAWKSYEMRELIARYPAAGAGPLAATLNRSVDSVTSLARRLGVPAKTRRVRQAFSRTVNSPTVNARFFDRVTPEVAYLLGFLSAGGIKMKHRMVLRVSVDDSRSTHFSEVLGLLESGHQVQQYGDRLVVEICNSYLVRRLVERFDWPPGQHRPAPRMPPLPDQLVPHFARGHLHRSGCWGPGVIRWTGLPRHTSQMAWKIQVGAGVGSPERIQYGAMLNIAWTDPDEVKILESWLIAGRPVAV